MSKYTPARPALDVKPVEQRILIEAFKLRYGDKGPYEATALIGFLDAAGLALVSKSELRNNAPTIIRLLEAVAGMEKVGAKILAKLDSEHASVTQWDADELREALATLRAAREVARLSGNDDETLLREIPCQVCNGDGGGEEVTGHDPNGPVTRWHTCGACDGTGRTAGAFQTYHDGGFGR